MSRKFLKGGSLSKGKLLEESTPLVKNKIFEFDQQTKDSIN